MRWSPSIKGACSTTSLWPGRKQLLLVPTAGRQATRLRPELDRAPSIGRDLLHWVIAVVHTEDEDDIPQGFPSSRVPSEAKDFPVLVRGCLVYMIVVKFGGNRMNEYLGIRKVDRRYLFSAVSTSREQFFFLFTSKLDVQALQIQIVSCFGLAKNYLRSKQVLTEERWEDPTRSETPRMEVLMSDRKCNSFEASGVQKTALICFVYFFPPLEVFRVSFDRCFSFGAVCHSVSQYLRVRVVRQPATERHFLIRLGRMSWFGALIVAVGEKRARPYYSPLTTAQKHESLLYSRVNYWVQGHFGDSFVIMNLHYKVRVLTLINKSHGES